MENAARKKKFLGIIILLVSLVLLSSKLLFPPGYYYQTFHYALLALVSGGSLYFLQDHVRKGEGKKDEFLRGRKLQNFDTARRRARALSKSREKSIFWGGLNLPESIATTHFLATGGTGSGKTITLRLLMQSVLPRILPQSDRRALLYDGKQDMFSILHGMNLPCKIVTLNPFDKRCAAWDMGRDITSPGAAQQLAKILIPENEKSVQRYFSDAARQLLKGVILSLMREFGQNWTFRDVVLALKSTSVIKELFSGHAETDSLLRHLDNQYTGQNVMGTVVSYMESYEIVAALWEKAEDKVSLEEWVAGEFILVLGTDERLRAAIDPINRAIFERLTELVLSSSESTTRKTWFFIDEAREAGELKGLGKLLTKGRSKGACVVIGFQDIEGMRACYGKEQANEIAGLCANKAFLRMDDPETAKWASSVFGEKEVIETRYSESSNSNHSGFFQTWRSSKGGSTSRNEHVAKREAILSSQLMDLPVTNLENGLSGIYLTPLIGPYGITIPGNWISGALRPAAKDVANLISRPTEEQTLSPWTEEERKRLKLLPSKREPGNGGNGAPQGPVIDPNFS